MAGNTIHGTGRQRRNDVYNRVVDLILKGQAAPTGGFYGPVMAKLMSTPPQSLTEIELEHPTSGLGLIICGVSECGGPDVCG